MSSRARIVRGAARVERFDWASHHGDSPARADRPPRPRDPPHPRETDAAAAPRLSAAEQEAHLAGLEREAFAKGYAQGERTGLEAGAKRADAMLRRVAQTLDDLAQLRRTIIRQTERELVELALTLARRVVAREIALDPALVAAMAHVALQRLGESTPASIKLHPEDYATICAQRGEHWEGAQVTIVPDAAVPRGGCLVESDFGTIDGSLEAQFDEMARALLSDATTAAGHGIPHVV
jgi:flagellar assembly protein FliH